MGSLLRELKLDFVPRRAVAAGAVAAADCCDTSIPDALVEWEVTA